MVWPPAPPSAASLVASDWARPTPRARRRERARERRGRRSRRASGVGASPAASMSVAAGAAASTRSSAASRPRTATAARLAWDGLCEVDRSRNRVRCSDCLVCDDGACEIPNNEFCQDHQLCRPENGRCCEKCLNDRCCEIGEVCIKPVSSGPNSCCNTARNEPCGDNGDGTYRECCVSGVEECVQGTCELRIPCPGGRLSAQGLCCEGGQAPCWGPEGPFCPPPGHTCCGAASCDATQRCCDETRSLCCPIGQCAAGQCCNGGLKGCNGECVDTQTDKRHCGRCGFDCIAPGFDCCSGSCTNLMSDEENCGACGNTCNPLSEVCREGECREICSLNQPPWRNPCDDGVDHWCCPDGSTQCCRLSGQPHCC